VAEHRIANRKQLQRKPDMTLAELRDGLGWSTRCPPFTMCSVDMELTYKKTLRTAEQDIEEVAKARRRWNGGRRSEVPTSLLAEPQSD